MLAAAGHAYYDGATRTRTRTRTHTRTRTGSGIRFELYLEPESSTNMQLETTPRTATEVGQMEKDKGVANPASTYHPLRRTVKEMQKQEIAGAQILSLRVSLWERNQLIATSQTPLRLNLAEFAVKENENTPSTFATATAAEGTPSTHPHRDVPVGVIPTASQNDGRDLATVIRQRLVKFWYELEFMKHFPQVLYWYFGSSWTGRVRVSAPLSPLEDTQGTFVTGFMQFVDEQSDALPYSIGLTNPVEVYTPLPPLIDSRVSALNLPLRLRLGELVTLLTTGDILADEWLVVTSLVERSELPDLLSTTATTAGRNWIIEQLPYSPRELLAENMADLALATLIASASAPTSASALTSLPTLTPTATATNRT
jgi:hypothetical protein